MIIKDAEVVGILPWLKFVWKGHISNWFWKESLSRRLRRQQSFQQMKMDYLRKYIPFVEGLRPQISLDQPADDRENVFSLWFQGEENAPKVVKSCLRSVRRIYADRFIVLDEKTMGDYISLPDYIMEKWRRKEIGPANFSDIVRIDLLTRHGGYWFDATDYLLRPVPEFISHADFFIMKTSPVLYTHMFVQTCFIRARKGDPLISMWRDTVFHYWKHEKKAADYFIAHLLLKLLVSYNPLAKELFEKMPEVFQDSIHDFWYVYGHQPYSAGNLKKIEEAAFFQKCSYRHLKHAVNQIKPGTLADSLINHAGNPPQVL